MSAPGTAARRRLAFEAVARGELVTLTAVAPRTVCRRCYRDRPPVEPGCVGLVSPAGRAHRQGDDGYSACGLDARSWWWSE